VSEERLDQLDRATLARLGREYMLAAQCNSRVGYAALAMNHGPHLYKEVAIENWMSASPVYTQRMQNAMGLRGDSDVETILKGLQLECGFSHQYFDTHFRMTGKEEGEFWLPSCGALLEAEPRGEEAVKTMCHDIEDPTFDATAIATNPRAQVRPVHRPPRLSPDQSPHCHWTVAINPEAEPVSERPGTHFMRSRLLAGLTIARHTGRDTGGWDYYDSPLLETLHLEQFSQSALALICKELAVQLHLLVQSLGYAIAQRFGTDAATAVADFQLTGAGWATSARLARALGFDDSSQENALAPIAAVLKVHPAFKPYEYLGVSISHDDNFLAVVMDGCPAAREEMSLGWYPLYRQAHVSALEALVQGVNPKARLKPLADSRCGWEVVLVDEAIEEPLSVQIAKGTVLYATQLDDHEQVLNVV